MVQGIATRSPSCAWVRGPLLAALTVFLLGGSVEAQTSWDTHQIDARPVTAGPPVLDGFLNEQTWRDAVLVDGFIQQEPNEGAPASELTELRITYDAENLYIGVRAFTQKANQIDYHRRILEWFGHYLKDEPAPEWITQGIPWLEHDEERARVSKGLKGDGS